MSDKGSAGPLERIVGRQLDTFPHDCVCDGEGCPGCDATLAAEFAAEIAAADARYAVPPCLECGAVSPEDAQGKCRCSGDKDDCHGCRLWPD